jgi:hypothetical protein
MRTLNRSQQEIDDYYASNQFRDSRDFIRGRPNYVGGREEWEERAIRLREEEEIERAAKETEMARFREYYESRGMRGRGGRGRGYGGRGRGRSEGRSEGRGNYNDRGHDPRDRDRNRERDGAHQNGSAGDTEARNGGRDGEPNNNGGRVPRSNYGRGQPRRGRGGRYPGRGEAERSEERSQSAGNEIDIEIDTPEVANAARQRAPNPYEPQSNMPPSGFNAAPHTEGSNRNTDNNQQPQSLPVAEMRSNNAPQDDQMPVGQVIVGVAENQAPPQPQLTAHERNVISARRASSELNEARRDSMRRLEQSRRIYGNPMPPRSQERPPRSQEQVNMIQSGTMTTINTSSVNMELLRSTAERSPMAADPDINVWAHEGGYLVFDNMRTYESNEAIVITQEILENPQNFTWSTLGPLSNGLKWDTAVSIAAFKTADYCGEPPNRHAIFSSGFFPTLSMSSIERIIKQDNFARSMFRKHQASIPFLLTPETAYPLMNPEMFTQSMLNKLQSQVICPAAALQALKSWGTRMYPFHQLQLLNTIDTSLDTARVRPMLHTPGEYHEWAREINPEVIFRPSYPVNIEYIQERIDARRNTHLEEQSLREVFESEADLPDPEESERLHDEEMDQAEASVTGVPVKQVNGNALQGMVDDGRKTAQAEIEMDTAQATKMNEAEEILDAIVERAPNTQHDIVQTELIRNDVNQVTVQDWVLDRAREIREPVVLAGSQGGPEIAEGFEVTEYMALEVLDGSPVESYPQNQDGSQNEQYRRAIDDYIVANYPLAVTILRKRLERYNDAQIAKIATSGTKLEVIIESMELRLYTPQVTIEQRAGGRYFVPTNDPALLLPSEEHTFLLQIVIKENKEPMQYVNALQMFCKILNPEHEMDVVVIHEVLPNLTERIVTIDSEIVHPIRIRFKSSFCFKSFYAIETATSYIRQKWMELNNEYLEEYKIIAHRPISMWAAAIFPGILPEHGLEEVKIAICNIKSILLESDNDIMMDWSDDMVQGVTSGNFATLYATKVTKNLLRNVCDIPLRLPNAIVQPIEVGEVNDVYHAEAIANHSRRMQECTVCLIEGLPKWASPSETRIIPPTVPNEDPPANMSIEQYVKSMGPGGTINNEGNQLFEEVLNGNQPTKIVITIPARALEQALALIPIIQEKIQESVPEEYTITGRVWPQNQNSNRVQIPQGLNLDQIDTDTQPQEPADREANEAAREERQSEAHWNEESNQGALEETHQPPSDDLSDANLHQNAEDQPNGVSLEQDAANENQGKEQIGSDDDSDTLFTRELHLNPVSKAPTESL